MIEAVCICLAALMAGLVINHSVVSRSFDGSLIASIKAFLENDVADDINQSGNGSGIFILDSEGAKRAFDGGDALFIDARPTHSYNEGHIPGAVNITEQTLDLFLVDVIETARETAVIAYCTGPECPQAKELAELLVENEITPVYVYTGGWDEWEKHAYPAATGEEP